MTGPLGWAGVISLLTVICQSRNGSLLRARHWRSDITAKAGKPLKAVG